MAKRKNESQLSMVNNYWSPAILCDRPLETDFVRDGFVVLQMAYVRTILNGFPDT